MVPVSEAPRLWWRFAAQASLQQKRLWYVLVSFKSPLQDFTDRLGKETSII